MTERYSASTFSPSDAGEGASTISATEWSSSSHGARTDQGGLLSELGVSEARGHARDKTRQEITANPIRRLRGFLISTSENQARVGFVGEDDSVVEYLLPEKLLRKAGINAVNQPFEMDEIEQKVGDSYLSGYVFRPMADAQAVVTDIYEVDEDLAELRNEALRYFGGETDN